MKLYHSHDEWYPVLSLGKEVVFDDDEGAEWSDEEINEARELERKITEFQKKIADRYGEPSDYSWEFKFILDDV